MLLALRSSRTARALARRLGLAKHRTEDRVRDVLRRTVQAGDIAWDVGANVGEFTALLSELVGAKGQVIAFEPVPDTCATLEQRARATNVAVHCLALGNVDEQRAMQVSGFSPESSLVAVAASDVRTIGVRVVTGDRLVADREAPLPTVIKVDVEGFEYEVLDGLRTILHDARAVVVEVHFALLDAAGRKPSDIVRLLRACGFRVRWIDGSHILAKRST